MRLKNLSRTFLATTILATVTFLPGATGSAAPSDNRCWTYKESEKRLARLTNDARSNLGKLKLDPELSRVAEKQARQMAKTKTVSHSPEKRLANRITNWVTIGENVGAGANAQSLHQAFMDSPTHRDNILEPSYKNVGVFTIKRDGRLWAVVIFEGVKNPGTTFKMPSC